MKRRAIQIRPKSVALRTVHAMSSLNISLKGRSLISETTQKNHDRPEMPSEDQTDPKNEAEPIIELLHVSLHGIWRH